MADTSSTAGESDPPADVSRLDAWLRARLDHRLTLVLLAPPGEGMAAAEAMLAATLAAVPTIPVAGLTLLLGVDRFMSEARALTNLVGNVVATLVVAKWDGALDEVQAHRLLDGHEHVDLDAPVRTTTSVDLEPATPE